MIQTALLLALAAVVTARNPPVEALLEVNQAHLNAIKDSPITSPQSAYNLAIFHEAIHGAFNLVNLNLLCWGSKQQQAQVNVISK
jgi:hypothetical protein